jgi:TrmH family RNA methyltransferase
MDMALPAKKFPKKFDMDNTPAIASRDNRWLKRFRAALSGERRETEMIGVEGVRMVEAALGSGWAVEALLVSDSGLRHMARLAPLMAAGTSVLQTSDKLFADVADTQTPQGIAALVQPPKAAIERLTAPGSLVIVLAGVQDPGNVGTIVRAADAFGATAAAACTAGGMGTADPFGPKALRASAGSALRLPIVQGKSAEDLVERLRDARVKVYAAVAPAAGEDSNLRSPADSSLQPKLPWEVDWTSPSAILIGNEGAGLPAKLVHTADARVCVPQAAPKAAVGVESLNAAMAASVLLYEAMRQRRKAQ